MLVRALDKENVHHAAPLTGKNLNGKLAPKTPGPSTRNPKTPFKIPLNDGNGENGIARRPFTAKKINNVDGDQAAFVTPAPKQRTALGRKDTNAKTGARSHFTVKQDAQLEEIPSTVSKPARQRASLASRAEPTLKPSQMEDPSDIEYMPPKAIDLPYNPDSDDDTKVDLKRLKDTLYDGMFQAYMFPVGDDGKTKIQRCLDKSPSRKLVHIPQDDHWNPPRGIALEQAELAPKLTAIKAATSKPIARFAAATAASSHKKHAPVDFPGRRPTSSQSKLAASKLSKPASSHGKENTGAPILTKGHARAASAATAAPRKPLGSTSVADLNSKSTIGFNAGSKLAPAVKKRVIRNKSDLSGPWRDLDLDFDAYKENEDLYSVEAMLRTLQLPTELLEGDDEDDVFQF